MEHRLELVDRCHSSVKRYGADRKQLATLRSLDNWARWSNSSNIGWPLTFRGTSLSGDISKELSEGEWMLKPYQSAGGLGIVDLENASQQSDSFVSDHSRFYVQRRIPGESIGVTFLGSEFGSTLLGATSAHIPDLKPTRKDYIYRGSFGPIPISTGLIQDLQCFARLVHNESGILGLWQADFLMHNGELTLLEINPRWTASMDILDLCLELRLVEKHYASISANLTHVEFERISTLACMRAKVQSKAMLHKVIAYACIPFTVSQSQSDGWWMNRWKGDLNSVRNRIQFADIPFAGTKIGSANPILTVMTTSNSINIADVLRM